MKKVLACLFMLSALLLTACGGNKKMDEINQTPNIESQVIYNKNGLKITADSLDYGNWDVSLLLTIENKSNETLKVVAGSMGYSVNSINGWMVEDGYVYCEIEPNQTEEEEMSFDYNSLYQYGITEIACLEVGFSISDDDYNTSYTDPIQIKTSAYDKYDFSTNKYQEVMKNGAFKNKFECEIIKYSNEVLYDSHNISLESYTCVKNKDGETSILFEIKNDSNEEVVTSIQNVYINDKLIYDSYWTLDSLNAKTSFVTYIDLANLIDEYEGNMEDVTKVKKISFEFAIGEKWYDLKEAKTISIELPTIEVKLED